MPESHAVQLVQDTQNTQDTASSSLPRPTMKFASVALALLTCASTVSAQYFSEGWTPGKPVTEEPPKAGPTSRPKAAEPQTAAGGLSSFDMTWVLESAPVVGIFNRMGINITATLEAARNQVDTWDSRIPLITDNNYDELIVREPLSEEEKESRIWFLVM